MQEDDFPGFEPEFINVEISLAPWILTCLSKLKWLLGMQSADLQGVAKIFYTFCERDRRRFNREIN